MKESKKEVVSQLGSSPANLWRIPGRIFYIAGQSNPNAHDGPGLRINRLASVLVQHGHSVVVAKLADSSCEQGIRVNQNCVYNGIRYLDLGEMSIKDEGYVESAAFSLRKYLRVFKPSAVMAGFCLENALPALIAAHDLGLPFIYEVRDFDEIPRATMSSGVIDGSEHGAHVALVTAIAKAADRVFTLSDNMRDDLIRHGVNSNKIDLAPTDNDFSSIAKYFKAYGSYSSQLTQKYFTYPLPLSNQLFALTLKEMEMTKLGKPRPIGSIDTDKKITGLTLLDPISELCWKNEFYSYPIVREKFDIQINGSNAKLAFFESAWRANKAQWEYAFTSPGLKHSNAQALLSAINLLKKKNIPILFWNKEDPMHYDLFMPIAKHADFVFTTDESSLMRYKKDLKHNNIFPLPFAAPVKITNPKGRFDSVVENVCFAGTYYAQNHEDRKIQMDKILPSLLKFDGVIYDRASSIAGDKYAFPDQYQRLIREAVDFNEMVALYKRFKVFLNVNTITNSPTMMSRRVYELLASGTPVVSTPSKSISEQFPGIVLTVNTEEETNSAVEKLLTDDFFWYKQSHLGIRSVMNNHTYSQRWGFITDVIGADCRSSNYILDKVAIVYMINGNFDERHILSSIINQKAAISDIVFIMNKDVSKTKIVELKRKIFQSKNIKVHFTDAGIFSIDKLFFLSDAKYLVFMSDANLYFSNYISDMKIPFIYDNCKGVCKSGGFSFSSLVSKNSELMPKFNGWHTEMNVSKIHESMILMDSKDHFDIDLKAGMISSKNKAHFYGSDPFSLLYIDSGAENICRETLNNIVYKFSPLLDF